MLAYDREVFDAQSAAFEEYPFLLSRRYQASSDVDEIQDFHAELGKADATVTLTFSEVGRAYNMGDHWVMYGFETEPASITGREVVIEEESTENSDYTLWKDLDFRTTTFVSFPSGTTALRWDGDDSALVWEVPQQAAALRLDDGNLLQRNRTAFIALFAVLLAASLGVGVVLAVTGRRQVAPASADAVSERRDVSRPS